MYTILGTCLLRWIGEAKLYNAGFYLSAGGFYLRIFVATKVMERYFKHEVLHKQSTSTYVHSDQTSSRNETSILACT